jgi:hypothetical protein
MITASDIWTAASTRIKGPGGLYNAGNLLGLSASLAVAAVEAPGGNVLADAVTAVWGALAGNPASVALTVATLIFLWSGEHYHRAWLSGFPPDARMNRAGDLSSGFGAVALGLGLALLADPILAVSSGGLHAAGKFGSAFGPQGNRTLMGHVFALDNIYRGLVVVSRAPAIAITLWQLARIVFVDVDVALDRRLLLVTVLGCYCLWTAADLLLMQASLKRALHGFRAVQERPMHN